MSPQQKTNQQAPHLTPLRFPYPTNTKVFYSLSLYIDIEEPKPAPE